jgi:hypothetical protein
MKRLYSISFVWPSGKTWSGVGGNRLSPQWYYECLLDFIKRNSGKEYVRFVVHMHETIRSTLPTAPIHESCVPPSTLSIEYCNAELPPMWPNVTRSRCEIIQRKGVKPPYKGVKPWRPKVAHGSSDEVSVQSYKC